MGTIEDGTLQRTPDTEAAHDHLNFAHALHADAESGLKHRDAVEVRLEAIAHQVDAVGHLVSELLGREQARAAIHPAALEDRPNLVGIQVRDYVSGDSPKGQRLVRSEFVEGTPDSISEAGRRVDFVYDHPDEGVQQRAVLPGEVKIGRNGEYVVAYDLDRGDWRNFRLDRVVRARGCWR